MPHPHLGRLSLLLPVAALTTVLTVPAPAAYAATECLINGTPGLTGTAGDDEITCSSVDPGDIVNALDGDDTITLAGPVSGEVRGGGGVDAFTLTETGVVNDAGSLGGQSDNDSFDLFGEVHGDIRGGRAQDRINLPPTSSVGGTADIRGGPDGDFIGAFAEVLIAGLVEGNEANDNIMIFGTVTPTGAVNGGEGDDFIVVFENEGTVNGGPGTDNCAVFGNPPVLCEPPTP